MIKKIKKILEDALSAVILICIATLLLYSMRCAIEGRKHSMWHKYESVRSCTGRLQYVLDWYAADERCSAIADTDEKIRAYRSIDEIIETELCFYNEAEKLNDIEPYNYCLEKIFEGRKEYGKNPYERLPSDERFCFEEEVVRSLEMYIRPKGDGRYFDLGYFNGNQIWIWIQGSREEGYEIMVLPGKKDPFLEVR